MNKRKAGAIALSLALATAICAPTAAFAIDDAAQDASTTQSTVSPLADTNSTLTGKIKATTVSVSVPTAAAFTLDPWTTATDPTSQIGSPTNYTITNLSKMPVYTRVKSAAVAAATVKNTGLTPSLVSTAPANNGEVQFAVKQTAPTDFTTAGDWLTTSVSSNYYVDDAGTGFIAATGVADGTDKITMKFYGQAYDNADGSTNWTPDDTFTVTPTFEFSTNSSFA